VLFLLLLEGLRRVTIDVIVNIMLVIDFITIFKFWQQLATYTELQE